MSATYVCYRCDRCEATLTPRQVQRIGTRPHCRPCKRAVETETCSECGHLLHEVHTPFGCLTETEDGWCPCGPPALQQEQPR